MAAPASGLEGLRVGLCAQHARLRSFRCGRSCTPGRNWSAVSIVAALRPGVNVGSPDAHDKHGVRDMLRQRVYGLALD